MPFLRASHASYFWSFLLLTTLLISTEVAVTHTSAFGRHPAGLSMAVLFDLVCVTTGLFYWLVAKPRQLANSWLALVALLMVRVALFILPPTAFPFAQSGMATLMVAEGTMLLMAGLRIRTMLRTYRQLRPTMDAEPALSETIASVFGHRIAGFIIGEGLTFYYILLGWRLQSDVPAGARTLTTHRQSGQVALTVGLLLIGLIETVAVHLLVTRWNATLAGWLTALSIYGSLYFVADLIATLKHPSYLTADRLYLRLGVRWRVLVDRSLIADVSTIYEKPPKQPGLINGSFLTVPNIKLTFREPIVVTGPFGIQKIVRQLTFFVDDQTAFVRALQEPGLS